MAATPYASASLYVGDLKNEVTESNLFEVFKSVGTVASIRVCRDAITRRSLGYAYVNFHNTQEAERALDTMNYTLILGKPCRIMWSHRDPSRRRSGVGNIFIKNLDKEVNNQQLYDTFSSFGNILSCKVETDDNGQSKGYGYVHFDSDESAKNAVTQVNGKLLLSKQVFVGPFLSNKDRERTSGRESHYTNIYVKNLDSVVTDDQLNEEFKQFGKITSGVVMKDQQGASRGFGFVNFETHEAAKKAVEEMNGKKVAGKEVYVARAQKKTEREKELRSSFERSKADNPSRMQGVNLYVRNLEEKITDDDLRQLFQQFGTITSAKVMKDERGSSKGFGFVCFSSPEEALKAINEMNGSIFSGKPFYVALAQKKEDRRAQLEQQMRRTYQPYMQPVWYPGMGGINRAPPMMFSQPPQMIPRWPQSRPPRGPYPYGAGMPGGQGPQQGGAPGAPAGGNIPPGMPGQQGGPQQGPGGMPGMQGQRGAPMQGGRRGMQGPPGMMGQPRSGGRGGPRGYPPQGVIPPQGAPVVPSQQPAPVVPTQQPAPVQQTTAPQTTQAPQQPQPSQDGPLSQTDFDTFSAAGDIKQALGERLFNQVMAYHPQESKCGKITGMLLESIELKELNSLLGTPVLLKQKIDEANDVYENHQKKQQQTVEEAPAQPVPGSQ